MKFLIRDFENLPINKWFHLGVRLQGKFFDVIINGNIKKRVVMEVGQVPKQNNYDIHVAPGTNNFSDSLLSNLQYHAYALSPIEMLQLSQKGPNLDFKDKDDNVGPPYLAMNWYIND